MFYVYVLRSLKNRKRYIGSTKLLPQERLIQHNSGSSAWTRQNGPLELIYQEEFLTNTEARKRENFLKSGVGRKFLDEKLGSGAVSSAGRAIDLHSIGRRFEPCTAHF